MNNKVKRNIIIVLISLICFTLVVGAIFVMVNRLGGTAKERKYMSVYKEKAVEFVKTQVSYSDRSENNLYPRVEMSSLFYKEEYSKPIFSPIRTVPKSFEEFESWVENITIWVAVSRKEYCVVVFEKNENDIIEVKEWYWEKK